jgi:hypothetical protein
MFTGECIVFRKKLGQVDMTDPIKVMIGPSGEKLVTDGNHRAYRAEQTGEKLLEKEIGSYEISVVNDPNYRPISSLRVVDTDPPFSD